MVSSAASLLEENPNEIQFFFIPCRMCRVEACEVCITGDVSHTNIMAVHQDNLNKASERVNFKQNESKMTKGLQSLMNPWLYELLAVFQWYGSCVRGKKKSYLPLFTPGAPCFWSLCSCLNKMGFFTK